MNKYQEAIEDLNNDYQIGIWSEEAHELVKILQEPVDKITPMKVKIETGKISLNTIISEHTKKQHNAYCPKCNAFLYCSFSNFPKTVIEKHQYCGYCGQKLDWSDSDDK